MAATRVGDLSESVGVNFFFFLFHVMLNEVLESCEKWSLVINPLTAPVLPHTETSRLICCANKSTGFHIKATLAINRLKADVKQNEAKELVVPIVVVHSYFQNLKCNVKNTCTFLLILVGIPPGLTSPIKNRG